MSYRRNIISVNRKITHTLSPLIFALTYRFIIQSTVTLAIKQKNNVSSEKILLIKRTAIKNNRAKKIYIKGNHYNQREKVQLVTNCLNICTAIFLVVSCLCCLFTLLHSTPTKEEEKPSYCGHLSHFYLTSFCRSIKRQRYNRTT